MVFLLKEICLQNTSKLFIDYSVPRAAPTYVGKVTFGDLK